MVTQPDNKKYRFITRIMGWALVAAYTLSLPNVNGIYQAIERQCSSSIAGKVPAALIVLLGVAYLVSVLVLKKGLKSLAGLIPFTIITLALVAIEPNPNKHIHIPEYIVMAWILFEVLSIDYHGKGLFILIFVCSTLLGIVDELEQGIHPQRFFGWQDMIMNSAASVIGIFFLAGLRKRPVGDWTWTAAFRKPKTSLAIILCGASGAVLTCVYLFDVQTSRTFWDGYPRWLLVCNGLFLAAGVAVISCRERFCATDRLVVMSGSDPGVYGRTACLWMFCPLIMLLIIHGLVLMVAATGIPFR